MANIRIGCQTYTWEMLGDEWTGAVDDIFDAIAAAGYEGVEITTTMIGEYADRPADFRQALDRRGLTLAEAERALRFAAAFPNIVFQLGGAASSNR